MGMGARLEKGAQEQWVVRLAWWDRIGGMRAIPRWQTVGTARWKRGFNGVQGVKPKAGSQKQPGRALLGRALPGRTRGARRWER